MINQLELLSENLYRGFDTNPYNFEDIWWIWLWHSDPRLNKTQADGKLVCYRSPVELEKIAQRLYPAIKQGTIKTIKYRPKFNDMIGPFAHLLPPLCVYIIEKEKKDIKRLLLTLNISNVVYIMEEETKERNR